MKLAQKIGSFFIPVLASCALYASDPHVSLRVLSMQGRPLEQLVQGKRALIEIVATSQHGNSVELELDNQDVFELVQTGHNSLQVSSVNGVVSYTRRQQYIVSAAKIGQITIGPAVGVADGKKYYSKPLSVSVVAYQDDAAEDALESLTMRFDKAEYLLGESIALRARLEYKDAPYAVVFEPLQFKDFAIVQVGNPIQGTYKKDGQTYGFIEHHYQLQAKKVGSYVLPGARVTYQVARKVDHSGSGFFQHFFGPSLETKTLEANAQKVTINPLPIAAKGAELIGNFTKFDMTTTATELSVGDPVTVSLVLHGDGPFYFMGLPLTGLDGQAQVYESRKEVLSDKKGSMKVDYIVQPMHAGRMEIPAQHIRFYSPSAGAVRHLQTQPIMLDVQSSTAVKPASLENPSTDYPAASNKIIVWLLIISISASWLIFYRMRVCHYLAIVALHIRRFWWRLTAPKRLIRAITLQRSATVTDVLRQGVSLYYQDQLDKVPQAALYVQLLKKVGLPDHNARIIVTLAEQACYAQQRGSQPSDKETSKLFSGWRIFVVVTSLLACTPTDAADRVAWAVSQVAISRSKEQIVQVARSVEELLSSTDLMNLLHQQLALSIRLQLLAVAPLYVWQLCIGLFMLLMLVAAWYRRTRLLVFMQVLVMVVSLLFMQHEFLKFFDYGIVPPRTAVYYGPALEYSQRMVTDTYCMCHVLRQEKDWYLVRCSSVEGWIPRNTCELIRFE